MVAPAPGAGGEPVPGVRRSGRSSRSWASRCSASRTEKPASRYGRHSPRGSAGRDDLVVARARARSTASSTRSGGTTAPAGTAGTSAVSLRPRHGRTRSRTPRPVTVSVAVIAGGPPGRGAAGPTGPERSWARPAACGAHVTTGAGSWADGRGPDPGSPPPIRADCAHGHAAVHRPAVRRARHVAGSPRATRAHGCRGPGGRGVVVADDLVRHAPRPATVDELALVHERSYLDALESFCSSGGGHLDPDTVAVRPAPGRWPGWPPAQASTPSNACAPARPTRLPGRASARPPRHAVAGDGLLPAQQRRGRPPPRWPTPASGSWWSTSTPTTATAPRTRSGTTPG